MTRASSRRRTGSPGPLRQDGRSLDRAVRVDVDGGEEHERIDRPVVPNDVLVEWRLVQDVARSDRDVTAEAGSVLVGDLARRQ